MKLIYNVKDKPKFGQLLLFAFQQVLAILAATILVPAIIGNGMSQSAALFGAGVGTLIYQLFTKFRSPVFLGSSFAFIGSMSAAFAGAASMSAGYLGLLIGAAFAGLVYVIFDRPKEILKEFFCLHSALLFKKIVHIGRESLNVFKTEVVAVILNILVRCYIVKML